MQLSFHNVTSIELSDLRSLDSTSECYVRDLVITYSDGSNNVKAEITMFTRNQDDEGRELKVLA